MRCGVFSMCTVDGGGETLAPEQEKRVPRRFRCQDVNLPVPGREPLLRENVWTQIPTWLGSVFSPVHCGLLHVGVFIFTSPEGEIFPHSARERRLDLHHVELDVVAHKPVGDAGGVQVREGRI